MTPPSLLLAAFALAAAPQEPAVHVDELRGFRIEVPAGWSPVEQQAEDGSHVLYLVPPGSQGDVLVGVTHRELTAGLGADDLLKGSLAKIEDEPERFSEPEQGEVELLGRTCPTLSVVFASPQLGPLRIDAAFLDQGGNGYTLQRVAPPDEFAEWAARLDAAVGTFALVEPSAEGRRLKRLRKLASRCGSEVEWATSWEQAAQRARDLGRPMLLVLWLYRGFDLPIDPRSTIFMDQDVIALVNARYVPYWPAAGAPAPFVDRYGMSATSFGRALMVVTPDGEVLAESEHATDADAAHAFLAAALPHPEASERAGPRTLEAGLEAVGRGDPEWALEVLAENDTWQSWMARARALLVLRRGEEALEALEHVRTRLAEDPDPLAAACEADRLLALARVHLRMGRVAEARAACERLRAEHVASEAAHAARLLLALLDLQAGDRERARSGLEAMVDSHHDESRWTWQAAAYLRGGLLELDAPLDFGWPNEALLREAVDQPSPAPLGAALARSAREGALEWLLAAQREDGSWLSPTELSGVDDRSPSPFVDAITALATRALLAHTDDPRALAAGQRGLDFVLASLERRKTAPTRVYFMDYTPWSDGAMLDTVAAALAAGLGDEQLLRAAAAELVADLSARAQPHGGWGYYVTGDLDGAAAPPTSMSFTTAAAVLALAHARQVGIEVPDEVLEGKGVTALQAMRDREGVFAYSLRPGGSPGVARGMEAGAAGRSPVCELALLRADASDEELVARALELFLEHAHTLAAEQGKVIMHAGQQGQGCHYLFFDYAWAAQAWREVGGDAKARVRLLELVLDCRQADGSFLDTSINGRSYGTAMALLALDALGP